MAADDETTSIELLSTQMLRKLLDAGDGAADKLDQAARSTDDGVLGVNESGGYEILEKNSLDALMNETVVTTPRKTPPRKAEKNFGFHAAADQKAPAIGREQNVRQIDLKVPDGDDDLELVDTQMLRVILDEKRVAEGLTPKYTVPETPTGNPYDSLGEALKKSKEPPAKESGFNPYDSSTRRKR